MNNMVFRYLEGVAGGGLMMLVHTNRPPSDAEWDLYFREFVKHDPARIRSIAFTDGGAPSGAQRKQINDMLNGRTTRGAVVTASPFVRGVVTALSWFNAQMKAFAADEVDAALEHLGVRDDEMALVRREIQLLRRRLGHDDLKSIVAT